MSVNVTSGPPELDLKLYARIIWQRLWLILLCMIAAAVAAYVVSSLAQPIYQASTTLLVREGASATATYQDLIFSERVSRTYAELIQRDSVLQQVAMEFKVDLEVLEEIITDITVAPVRDTQLIKITIEGTSPEIVAAVADRLPRVFIEENKKVQGERFTETKASLQQRLDDLTAQIDQAQIAIDRIGPSPTNEEGVELERLRSRLNQLQATYGSMLQSLENINLAALQSSDSISIVQEPQIPEEPIRPRVLINTLLAAIVGAMLALGLIFLLEYLDDRIRTPQDLNQIVDLPLLAAIAELPNTAKKGWRKRKIKTEGNELIAAREPRHPIAEAFRSLRSNLQFASLDVPLDTLLVTSSNQGEGKTTTAANLAIVLAQAEKSVILVDADLRRPRVHRVFGLPQSPGVTEALLLESNDYLSALLRPTEVENLRVLTCGKVPPNPSEILGSQRMQRLIDSLKGMADIVIFDGPPLLVVTDSVVLSRSMAGVLWVIDTMKTSRSVVARAAELLLRANANVLGVSFNRVNRAGNSYQYYYYHEADGYYSNQDESLEVQGQATPALNHTAPLNNKSFAGVLVKDGKRKETATIHPPLTAEAEKAHANGYHEAKLPQSR